MAEGEENPIGAVALESLVEGPSYSDDSAAKPIARKKKSTRKRRHGELTESRLGQTNLITSFSGFQISKPMREAAFYFIF